MRRLLVPAVALILPACTAGSAPENDSAPHLVPGGKADNYYSDVASEYRVEGEVPVEMTEGEYDDPRTRADLVTRRLTAVGLYLTAYVTDKFRGIDSNGDGEISDDEVFFHNVDYGGFQAMVRNYTVEPVDVTADGEGHYTAQFELDMAGPRDMLSQLPPVEGAHAPDGGVVFTLQMPAGETVDPESVPRGQFRRFDPETHGGDIETLELTARQLPEPENAWPHYTAFFEDGVYDLTLFYGYDYNDARYDLQEARSAFRTLQGLDFRAPVGSFEQLGADSGPFVREANANGRDIRIEVRIFHSDMFEGRRAEQHDLALAETTQRDVFFYNGHAGPYYGFYLDPDKEASVDYHEFAEASFSDKQQLLVAQGCQTYSQYADMFYANPNKSEDNLDVITTVNYSYGKGTDELLTSLVELDADGHHQPVDLYRMVSDLNAVWLNDLRDVFYGVMGIEGNPQLHPYAHVESIGRPCSEDRDCGDPSGNVCLQADGPRRCAAVSLSAAGCPDGTRYGMLGVGNTIEGGVCHAPSPVDGGDDPGEDGEADDPAGGDRGRCERPIDLTAEAERDGTGSLVYAGSTAEASDDAHGGCVSSHGGREVALVYTPPRDGALTLSTEGPGTDFDTVLYVRTECSAPSSELACDDDGGSTRHTSTLTLEVTAGEPLYVFVDGWGADDHGPFELHARLE